jgi:hypothetical protein
LGFAMRHLVPHFHTALSRVLCRTSATRRKTRRRLGRNLCRDSTF